MKIEEVPSFMEMLSEATGRQFNDTQMDIWHAALSKYSFQDCKAALLEQLGSSSAFLTPADIATRVKQIRQERLQAAGMPPSPPELEAGEDWEPYVTVYQRWLGTWTEAILDGRDPEVAQQIALNAVERPQQLEATIPYSNSVQLKGPENV